MATLSFKENALLALQHKEPEYFPISSDMDTCAPRGVGFIQETSCTTGVGLDWFGQSWTFEPNIGGANPTPGVHLVPDITRWKEFMQFPDLSKLDWEGYAARDTASWDREHKLSRVMVGYGMWERMFSVMDFEDALCALMEEPEACYEFFGAVADHKIRLYDYLIRYYKPDILIMHDDYGSGGGMFMPPQTWRELLKPHLQRIIDSIVSKGVMYEHHCCGYFAPILGEIADMGCVATNTMHVCNKPAELKKEIGHKMCFIGGFDTQFIDKATSTEEEIRASIRSTIDDLAPGGSFIGSCAITNKSRSVICEDEMIRYGSTKYTCPRPDFDAERNDGLGGNPFLRMNLR